MTNYTDEQNAIFSLIAELDASLFKAEQMMKYKTNPTNDPIIFEVTQGIYDIRKMRRLIQRWRNLIEIMDVDSLK